MFRTKDFLVGVVICIVFAMGIGLFLPKPAKYPTTVLPLGTPLTTAPYKDFYTVSLPHAYSYEEDRAAFIEKIRSEYASQVPYRKSELEPDPLPVITETEFIPDQEVVFSLDQLVGTTTASSTI